MEIKLGQRYRWRYKVENKLLSDLILEVTNISELQQLNIVQVIKAISSKDEIGRKFILSDILSFRDNTILEYLPGQDRLI